MWCPYFWASEEGICGSLIPTVGINSTLIHNASTLIQQMKSLETHMFLPSSGYHWGGCGLCQNAS